MARPVLTANSPSAGYIAWTAFGIGYGGKTRSISASNTNKKYVWWLWQDGWPKITGATNVASDDFEAATILVNGGNDAEWTYTTGGGRAGSRGYTHNATLSHRIRHAGSYGVDPHRIYSVWVKVDAQGTNLAGLVIGGTSTGAAGYQVLIDARRTGTGSSAAFQIRKNGGSTPLVGMALPESAPVAGTWYRVEGRLLETGPEGKVYNEAGTLLGTLSMADTTITSGGGGVYAYNAATFDDFAIYSNQAGAGVVETDDVLPTNLTDNDLVLFINRNGTPVSVQNANVVDGSLIVNESIIGTAIAARTIDAGKIMADTLTAAEIQAGAITASELAISSYGPAIVLNGDMEDVDPVTFVPSSYTAAWERTGTPTYSQDTTTPLMGTSSTKVLIPANAVEGMASRATPVRAGEEEVFAVAFRTTVANSPVTLRAYYGATETFDRTTVVAATPPIGKNLQIYEVGADGTFTAVSPLPTPVAGPGISAIVEGWAVPLANTTYYVIGHLTAPTGSRWRRFALIGGLTSYATSKTFTWDALTAQPVVKSTVIGDGVISTRHMQAQSITAASGIIASLDAGIITVGTLDGDRIGSNEIIARHILAGEINTDHVTTAGLDATVIKFGFMSGDRIEANTLSVEALESSTMTGKTVTLSATGFLRGLNSTGGTGWLLNEDGYRIYDSAGVPTVSLNRDGTASFTGTVNASSGSFTGTIHAAGGTFTGNITSTATITGGDLVGGTFATNPVTTSDRVIINDDGLNVQREGTVNPLESPGYWFSSDWQTTPMPNTSINSGTYYSGWKLDWEAANDTNYDQHWKLVNVGGLIYKAKFSRNTAGTANATFYQDYSSTSGGTTVAAGQNWTWSAQVNSLSTADVAWVEADCLDASNAVLATFTGTGTEGTTTGTVSWRRCKISFITPTGTTKIRVKVIFPGRAATQTFYTAVWQLENKDHMTAWAGVGQFNAVPLDTTRSDSGYSRATFDLFRARADIVDNAFWGKVTGSLQDGQWRDGMLRTTPVSIVFEAGRTSSTSVPLDRYTATVFTTKIFGTPNYIGKIGLRIGDKAYNDSNDWAEIYLERGYGINLFVRGGTGDQVVRIGYDASYCGFIRHSARPGATGGNLHIDSTWNSTYLNWYGGPAVFIGNGAATFGPINAASFNVNSTEDSKSNMLPLTNVLDKFKKIQAVKYNRSNQAPRVMLKGQQTVPIESMSIVAESLLTSVPEAAAFYSEDSTIPYKTGDVQKKKGELFGVDINALSAVNTAAIQELLTRLELLEAKIKNIQPGVV